MKTLKQLQDELDTFLSSFKNWEDAIIAYLKTKPSFVEEVNNTLAVDGWNIEKFIDHVDDWVKKHEADKNPHKTSIAQLGGYTKEEILNLLTKYQKNDLVPLTKMRGIRGTIENKQLTVVVNRVFFQGRDHGKVTVTVPLGTAVTQIVHLVRSGTVGKYTFSIRLATSRQVGHNIFRIGEITTATTNPVFRAHDYAHIHNYQLSRTPLGHGIPVSNNIPTKEGVIDKKWFKDWK